MKYGNFHFKSSWAAKEELIAQELIFAVGELVAKNFDFGGRVFRRHSANIGPNTKSALQLAICSVFEKIFVGWAPKSGYLRKG